MSVLHFYLQEFQAIMHRVQKATETALLLYQTEVI